MAIDVNSLNSICYINIKITLFPVACVFSIILNGRNSRPDESQ